MQADEPIVRFVLRADRIHWPSQKIREKQFEPDKQGELSTFRVLGMATPAVETLGRLEVVSEKEPRLMGWGHFPASLIKEADVGKTLHLDPSTDPKFKSHPRHANIRGWPSSNDPEQKARRKAIMLYFSEKAELVFAEDGRQVAKEKLAG